MRIGFNFHTKDNYISGVEYYSLGLLCALLDIEGENLYTVFTNKPNLITSYVGNKNNLTVRDCSFLKSRPQRILNYPALPERNGLIFYTVLIISVPLLKLLCLM